MREEGEEKVVLVAVVVSEGDLLEEERVDKGGDGEGEVMLVVLVAVKVRVEGGQEMGMEGEDAVVLVVVELSEVMLLE